MDEAVSLRTELVDRAPEIDDSDMAEPDQATHEYGDYMASLAYFDQLVGQTIPMPIPTLPNDSISQEPVTNLIRILRGRLFTARFGEGQQLIGSRPDQRPELADLEERLADLANRHGEKLDAFLLASRTHPGFAYMRLAGFAGMVRPAQELDGEPTRGVVASAWWTPSFVAQRAASGAQLQDWERSRLNQMVEQLKEQLDLFHARLVRDLGLSHLRWWRQVGIALGQAIGNAIVQIVLALLVGFVTGFFVGH